MWGEHNKRRHGRLRLRVARGRMRTGTVMSVDEIDSGRGKAGYVCALRGDACALARSVDDIYTNKIGTDFASKGLLRSPQ